MEKLSATAIGESSVTLTLSDLYSYAHERHINWWYKESTQSDDKWTRFAQTTVDPTFSGFKSMTITDLVPSRLYNFSASIWAYDGVTETSTKLREVFVNAKTAEANGELVLSGIKPNSVTATVSGLVAVNYWREVKYYYRTSKRKRWTYCASRTIAPEVNPYRDDVGLPYTFTGLTPETQYDFAADLSVAGENYKSCQAEATTPYFGLSMPEMFDTDKVIVSYNLCHTIVPPDPTIKLTWMVPAANVIDETISTTTFSLYYKREEDEEATLIEEWTNVEKTIMTVFENETVISWLRYWGQADLDAEDWLLDAETIEVWITATHNGHSYSSEHMMIDVTRLFYWDTEKKADEDFGITADEWNRLTAYLAEAHEEFPDDFDDVTATSKSAGDDFTAALANAAGFGITATVSTYGTVEASKAESFASRIRAKMRAACEEES